MELGSNPNLHFEFISDRTIEADVNPPIPLEITKSKERKNMKIENKVRVGNKIKSLLKSKVLRALVSGLIWFAAEQGASIDLSSHYS
jgi:hypothetical protein